jgi:hypothetical protein
MALVCRQPSYLHAVIYGSLLPVVLYSQWDIFPYFLLWRHAFTFSVTNSCQKTKFPVDLCTLRNVYGRLATGPRTETQNLFPLFRNIMMASQFARTLCLLRVFGQLACFAALWLCRLTCSSHCVRLQAATLWDQVACASNRAPAVRQFGRQQYTWHVGTEQHCTNSQTAGISALRLHILLLFVVHIHVPAIL